MYCQQIVTYCKGLHTGENMLIPIFQIDAFTDRTFRGNPAAVCFLEAWPEDALMQSIAAENHLSETAFLVCDGERYGLRWFTPQTEVDLCGHATLASAYVIFRFLQPALNEVVFDTRSGELRVYRDGDLLRMDFPASLPVSCSIPENLATALGRAPLQVMRAGTQLLAVFADEDEVRQLAPDMAALRKLDAQGVIVTAPGSEDDFVSRYFAPAVGVPEDPVTGSAHCVLTPYWAERLVRPRLRARQVSQRGGEILCELRGDRVALTGQAVLFLRGEITLGG
jgi:PhzF family phenazine biosynthesis protein